MKALVIIERRYEIPVEGVDIDDCIKAALDETTRSPFLSGGRVSTNIEVDYDGLEES